MDTTVGIFASRSAAEAARTALVSRGFAAERIAISVGLTDDGIGAEAPGQSYENQRTRDDPGEKQDAQYGTQVRTGACVLSVRAGSREEGRRLKEILAREGARIVTRRP